jgi:hypothetical protein
MESDLCFDTDDPEFRRGFEMGMLWERLDAEGCAHMAVSAANAEMVLRVAKAIGCTFSGQDLGDDLISVEMHKISNDW